MTSAELRTTILFSFLLHIAVFVAMAIAPVNASAKKMKYIEIEMVELASPIEPVAAGPERREQRPPQWKTRPATDRPEPPPQQSAELTKPSASPERPAEAPVGKASPAVPAVSRISPASRDGGLGPSAAGVSSASADAGRRPDQGKPVEASKQGRETYLPFYRLSKLPVFSTRKEPAYPLSERSAGVEARVLAEVWINERGGINEVIIKKSGGRLFDRAVIDAIRASRFEPGYAGDRPAPAILQLPFAFRLR